MQNQALPQALKSRSSRVDLAKLARNKRFGRVTTFSALEGILVQAVENLLASGEPFESRDELHAQAREELERLMS